MALQDLSGERRGYQLEAGQHFQADVRLESLTYFDVRLESLTYFDVRLESLTYFDVGPESLTYETQNRRFLCKKPTGWPRDQPPL
jgi:hypothetical protein